MPTGVPAVPAYDRACLRRDNPATGARFPASDPFGDDITALGDKAELQRLRDAARATAVKDKRVNIRLSSADLMDIQARALAEGMPYQTLIASVLHKYVSGQLTEKKPA